MSGHTFRVIIRAIKETHPDILLPDSKTIVIGRGKETKIKDSRLSKKQLSLTAHYLKKAVKVEVLGSNPSVIAGETLRKGTSKLIKGGDRFNLLEDNYEYELKIDQKPDRRKEGPTSPEAKQMASSNPPNSHWSQGLYASMNDPKMKVYQDELVVIIKDKYPKARYHFLALPMEKIKDLSSMNKNHLPLLKHMHAKAMDLTLKYPDQEFILGYHAIPSMAQVHMHIISLDFDSVCLKTKKHWNSFTTDYLILSDKVQSELEKYGKIHLATPSEGKALLNKDLKCHRCDYTPKNMPDLKQHIVKHFKK